MKAKEFLKEFNKKHGTKAGEIWEQNELLKLLDGYAYQIPKKLNREIRESGESFCPKCKSSNTYRNMLTGIMHCCMCGHCWQNDLERT